MATHLKGLSLVPKSKYKHINLTSCSKMRVDLAAEIVGVEVQFNDNSSSSVGYHSYSPISLFTQHRALSISVADAQVYFDDPSTKETESTSFLCSTNSSTVRMSEVRMIGCQRKAKPQAIARCR